MQEDPDHLKLGNWKESGEKKIQTKRENWLYMFHFANHKKKCSVSCLLLLPTCTLVHYILSTFFFFRRREKSFVLHQLLLLRKNTFVAVTWLPNIWRNLLVQVTSCCRLLIRNKDRGCSSNIEKSVPEADSLNCADFREMQVFFALKSWETFLAIYSNSAGFEFHIIYIYTWAAQSW